MPNLLEIISVLESRKGSTSVTAEDWKAFSLKFIQNVKDRIVKGSIGGERLIKHRYDHLPSKIRNGSEFGFILYAVPKLEYSGPEGMPMANNVYKEERRIISELLKESGKRFNLSHIRRDVFSTSEPQMLSLFGKSYEVGTLLFPRYEMHIEVQGV